MKIHISKPTPLPKPPRIWAVCIQQFLGNELFFCCEHLAEKCVVVQLRKRSEYYYFRRNYQEYVDQDRQPHARESCSHAEYECREK